MKLKKIAAVDVSTLSKREIFISLILIGTLFFVFGFVSWVNAILIPYFKIACELTHFESYLVAFAFYIAYLVMSVPSSYLIKKIGFKKGIMLGFWIMAIGTFLFIPAAYVRTYSVFLTGLFIIGIGLAILQTTANPYVTILGPRDSGAKRMSIMGLANGVAGILGPLILGSIVLKDADNITSSLSVISLSEKTEMLNGLARQVILPYIFIAIILVIVAVLIHYSSLPEVEEEEEEMLGGTSYSADKKSILQFPHLLLGVFTLFIYVGTEVIAGNTIIGYGSFQGIPLSTAKLFTSLTLFCMLIGYVIGITCIPKYFSQRQSLIASAILGITFVTISQITSGYTSVLFIALLGLANSLMWPSIWPLAMSDLGRFTKTGSSLLVMAIAGGAVLPLLYEQVSSWYDPKQAYLMVVPCYLIIGLYAIWGHKLRLKKTS